MSRPRLLWHSNSPTAPTGYGVQTALFTPLLNRDYEVAISCFYGLEGSRVRWKGIPLFPGLGGSFGPDFLPMHAKEWGGGDAGNVLTFLLMDVWVLPPPLTEQLGGNLICWVPVDHDPAPPGVLNFLRDGNPVAVAMSRFGQEALSEVSPLYVPHGVDTSAYKPYPKKEVRKSSQGEGIPDDAFIVGMIAANKGRPSRKGFQYAFEAFAEFRKRHENSFLYLHTSFRHEWMQGEDLSALAEMVGIPRDALIPANQYRLHFNPHTSGEMARIISALDVVLNPTTGGGFEIVQLEAAACGVPSITTDFTGMPESAGPSPWKVGGTKFWTGQKSWNLLANVPELVNALEDCYRMTDKERRALAKRLRRHAEKYHHERVYTEHMLPALKTAEKRIRKRSMTFDFTEGLKPVEPPHRELKRKGGPSISIVTPWQDHPELAADYWRAVGGEDVHEVIIIDNASDPPLKIEPGGIFDPDVDTVILRMDENVGFCPANNIGLREATGDAVLFLNNDIALGIPGWLEAIRLELKSGRLVGANRREELHAAVDGNVIPYLDGWCLAGMREDFERLGGWDEEMDEPAYFSDNELCLRAKNAGFTFAAVSPPLIHLLNRTAGPPVGLVTEVTQRNYQRYSDLVRASKRPKEVAA